MKENKQNIRRKKIYKLFDKPTIGEVVKTRLRCLAHLNGVQIQQQTERRKTILRRIERNSKTAERKRHTYMNNTLKGKKEAADNTAEGYNPIAGLTRFPHSHICMIWFLATF